MRAAAKKESSAQCAEQYLPPPNNRMQLTWLTGAPFPACFG